MKLCIDSADVSAVARLCEYYPVDGVSTNPSILAKQGRPPYEVLRELRSIVGEGELFVQAVSESAEGMLLEAREIVSRLGERTLIKLPCVPEGYKAMKLLRKEGIRFIGTTVYTVMQGLLAAKCGAEYVAPYVNRIDDLGFDGVKVSTELHDAILRCGFEESGLLAASFKNTRQVTELVRYGVKAVTVSPEVFEKLVTNAAVDAAVEKFNVDFSALVGMGKTMLDC